jgi:hypothetical protein
MEKYIMFEKGVSGYYFKRHSLTLLINKQFIYYYTYVVFHGVS